MKGRRLLVAGLMVISIVGLPLSASPAVAQTSAPPTPSTCPFRDQLCAGLADPGGTRSSGGNPPVTPVGSAGGSGVGGSVPPSPFQWHRNYDPIYAAPKHSNNPFTGGATGIPAPSCTKDGVIGRPYRDELIDTRDGTLVSAVEGCEFPAQPGVAAAIVPPLPPAPPSPVEVWRTIPLPTPVLGINPEGKGLTGLKTWIWSTNPGSLAAQTSIRGYTATAKATAVRWVWKMWNDGDTPNLNPNPRVESSYPGSEGTPAATYVYETKGDYTVTLTVWWTGDFTFTGNGVPPQTEILGDTSRDATRPYHVIEVRSVLVSGQDAASVGP